MRRQVGSSTSAPRAGNSDHAHCRAAATNSLTYDNYPALSMKLVGAVVVLSDALIGNEVRRLEDFKEGSIRSAMLSTNCDTVAATRNWQLVDRRRRQWPGTCRPSIVPFVRQRRIARPSN